MNDQCCALGYRYLQHTKHSHIQIRADQIKIHLAYTPFPVSQMHVPYGVFLQTIYFFSDLSMYMNKACAT
jgi:hypothetical protein